jgi:hypothetical protein
MPPQQYQSDALKEGKIQLALQAIKQDANMSQQRAATHYVVPQSTLSDQRARRRSRADYRPYLRNLDNNKEKVVIQHILKLVARGFPPRLAAVADIANSLHAKRNLGPVGLN